MLRVVGLMLGLTLMLVLTGGALFGQEGAILFFGIAAVMNFFAYWFSDRVVLRMYGARVVDRSTAPELYGMVEQLAASAGVPVPTVAISDNPQANAFATGRSPEKAVVCFTRGILETLSPRELEGVAAHELAHIKNRHMLVGTIAATLAGAVAMVGSAARWGALAGRGRGGNPIAAMLAVIVAPIAAAILRMAISRHNEFDADRTGAEITGDPMALAAALERMEASASRRPMRVNPAAANLAIVNPFGDRLGRVASLFRTHPPTRDRVTELQKMAREMGQAVRTA